MYATLRPLIYRIGVGVLIILSIACTAHATECPQHYALGQAPIITNEKAAFATTELCLEAFAVMHSGVTRTPLWSAEHLVRDNIESAQSLSRKNAFYTEPKLLRGERAELRDYAPSELEAEKLPQKLPAPIIKTVKNPF